MFVAERRLSVAQLCAHRWFTQTPYPNMDMVEQSLSGDAAPADEAPNPTILHFMHAEGLAPSRDAVVQSLRERTYDHHYATYHLLRKTLKTARERQPRHTPKVYCMCSRLRY